MARPRTPVTLTAEEWELFTESMDCTAAAEALNRALTEALDARTRRDGFEHWQTEADDWAHYGAADTEPRSKAWSILAATSWRDR